MIELQSGDRIEVFYEDDPATTIRAKSRSPWMSRLNGRRITLRKKKCTSTARMTMFNPYPLIVRRSRSARSRINSGCSTEQ